MRGHMWLNKVASVLGPLIKVEQQLEKTSQLFTTMVNKYCRNGLRGIVTPK